MQDKKLAANDSRDIFLKYLREILFNPDNVKVWKKEVHYPGGIPITLQNEKTPIKVPKYIAQMMEVLNKPLETEASFTEIGKILSAANHEYKFIGSKPHDLTFFSADKLQKKVSGHRQIYAIFLNAFLGYDNKKAQSTAEASDALIERLQNDLLTIQNFKKNQITLPKDISEKYPENESGELTQEGKPATIKKLKKSETKLTHDQKIDLSSKSIHVELFELWESKKNEITRSLGNFSVDHVRVRAEDSEIKKFSDRLEKIKDELKFVTQKVTEGFTILISDAKDRNTATLPAISKLFEQYKADVKALETSIEKQGSVFEAHIKKIKTESKIEKADEVKRTYKKI